MPITKKLSLLSINRFLKENPKGTKDLLSIVKKKRIPMINHIARISMEWVWSWVLMISKLVTIVRISNLETKAYQQIKSQKVIKNLLLGSKCMKLIANKQ